MKFKAEVKRKFLFPKKISHDYKKIFLNSTISHRHVFLIEKPEEVTS